jgi:hypothetical protein
VRSAETPSTQSGARRRSADVTACT